MDDSSDASSPAAMVSSSSSSHRYPNWVMLDPHTRLNYPTPTLDYPEEEEHFRATHAYAETTKGDPIRASFRAVSPPGTSRLYVRWTPRTKLSSSSSSSWSYGREPKVVAAHRNSILVQNRSDFFVYTIHSVERPPPSLQRLPRCDLQFADVHPRSPGPGLNYMFSPSGIGLLSNCDTDEFVVADLMILPKEYRIAAASSDDDTLKEHGIAASRDDDDNDDDDDTPVEAGLCMFRSCRPGDGWKVTMPRLRHDSGQGAELIWWRINVVVPFGHYLCYVDYLRGVLFMDLLSECPELRYVHLPVTISAGDPTHNALRTCVEKSRSVCVTDGGGTMKFVEVVITTVFISFIREPVSSSYRINMWKLRQDSMTWEMESVMDDTELWSLQGYGDLPRVDPTFPLVSMEEPGVVCFVLRNIRPCGRGDAADEIWVIVVDMLNKTLRSSSRYTTLRSGNCFESDGNMASGSLASHRAFMACEFSKYLHVPEITR